MSVYVDQEENAFGRMVMCHMLADSLPELHAMAERIGMERGWFQPGSTPHYDVCKSRRRLALMYGAREIGREEVVDAVRESLKAQMRERCAALAEGLGTATA